MSRIDTKEVAALMKRCKIGVGGRNAMEQAHEIMADCYGTLGALSSERDALRAQVAQLREALSAAAIDLKHHRTMALEICALAHEPASEIVMKHWNANCGPFDRSIARVLAATAPAPEASK